tara:strand:+ start:210 stop:377 length:168 start_codon:yes stop_codon:yes gene_type:complete
MEINKGTELMLRRRHKKAPPSPVIKKLGTEITFSLLSRKFRFKLGLSWEHLVEDS